jgi:hypothetical protein
MGNVKSITSSLQYIGEFKDVFTSDDVLFCLAWQKPTVAQQQSQLTEHLGGSKHCRRTGRRSNRWVFWYKFFMTFQICHFCDSSVQPNLSVDKQLFKINNLEVWNFFQKYIPTRDYPDESIVRVLCCEQINGCPLAIQLIQMDGRLWLVLLRLPKAISK